MRSLHISPNHRIERTVTLGSHPCVFDSIFDFYTTDVVLLTYRGIGYKLYITQGGKRVQNIICGRNVRVHAHDRYKLCPPPSDFMEGFHEAEGAMKSRRKTTVHGI